MEKHHHHHVTPKSVFYLTISFVINLILSVVELIAGIVGGSVALIGDALHNTSDAFSILIAIIAYKIGIKKANEKYTYGFKRAEVIGAFVNLILLFISGVYLLIEGISKLITPTEISGYLIVWVSAVALIIDIVTAKLSHHHAHDNTNMKMVFLHNLADAFGSVGVIISGLCVIYFNLTFVDGVIALLIAAYMIFQSVVTFPKIVKLLMNAVPDKINMKEIVKAIKKIKGVQDVHHIHIWNINERDVSLECHVVGKGKNLIQHITDMLASQFDIRHSTIQIECDKNCCDCHL